MPTRGSVMRAGGSGAESEEQRRARPCFDKRGANGLGWAMTDPINPMTYGDYLALDRLLDAQHPLSDRHDELLFIIIHQTKELWLKQIIAELLPAKALIRAGRPTEAYKNLARISRIQAVMTLSWDVLATMTPSDYTRFRDVLGRSSGFQSEQFRDVEVLLGLRGEGLPEAGHAARPSLWDDANAALAAAGFAVPDAALQRDWHRPYVPSDAVEAAWAQVYARSDDYWALYQLAEKLVDIDDAMVTWRHKHVLTVSRIIGGKRGTGGSAGLPYLEGTLVKRAFPELWSLRTMM